MEEKRPLLSVRDLTVRFRVRGRELTAIRGLSLDLFPGESLAVVGESGSGKSVLTKAFCGMLESNGTIAGGQILYREGDRELDLTKLRRNGDWVRLRGSGIAMIFQDPMTSLDPIMPIGRQILSVIRRHQKCSAPEAKRRALSMMEKVGIPEPEKRFRDYPFQYSGGMRQRIVIAIALACRPKILICDEPTTALDVTIQAQILELIKDLQKEFGYSIVFITHDLGVVANIADRVAVLYAGQILELGTAEEIFYDPRHPYTWALLSSLPQLGRPGGELYSIPGSPPTLYGQLVGDAFAPRNPYRLRIDGLQEPPLFPVTDTHFARTWLLDPRAPRVEKPEAIRDLHRKMLKTYDPGGQF